MNMLKNKKILLGSIIFVFLISIFLISNSGAIYKQKLSTNANLNIENSEYTIVFNGNGNTSGTTASKTCEYTVNCQLTPNGFVKTGYHFDGWSITANGAKAYDDKVSVLNLTLTGEYPLYARWAPNELVFNNQSITKAYNTSTQTIEITEATNGTGEYTYTKTSEKNSSNIDTNYITLSGTTLTASANTPIGTYTVVITVTDANSGAVKSATYTITMEKSTPTVTLTEKTGMVYTGSEQVANTATVSPALDGTLTYTYYTDNACTVPYTTGLTASNIRETAWNAGQLNQIPDTNIYIFKGGTTNPPANYVKFNCSDPSDTSTCEDWRIIGIYNGQMKIIRVNSSGVPTAPTGFTSVQWHTTTTNPGWANSSLKESLNTTYYNTLSDTAKDMIDENGSWDVGPAAYDAIAKDAYTQATTSGTKVGDTTHITPWTGKVGLMATYEFLYASGGGDTCLTTSGNNYDLGCGTAANDWLLNTGSNLWTVSPRSASANYALFVFHSGIVGNYRVNVNIAAVPAVFLKSSVRVASGDGTNPKNAYILNDVSSIPVNVSTYYAKASVSETANYNSAESACVAHTIAKSNTTTTLSAITNEYNGTSQPATGAISTLNSNNSAITNGVYTYTYYEGTSCDGIALAGAPTNAGVYRVKVTLTGTSNYNGSTSSCTPYTMNPKKATINLGTIPELTYGSDATMTYTYDGDGVVSCTSSDTTKVICSVNTSTNEITLIPVSATDSDVTITISAGNGTNYSTADNKTATIGGINKYEPTVILTEKTGMSWDNTPKNANQASVILINGENYSGDITYTYYTDSSCTTGATPTAPTLAGNYYVKASIIAQGNYNSAESSCVAHTIGIATPTVTLTPKSASELVYTGNSIVANAATVLPNAEGEITYKYYSDSSCTNSKVWAENLSYSNTKNGTDINCTDAQCAIDTLANILLNNSSGTVIEKSNNLPKNVGTYYVKASVLAVANKTNAAESSCVAHIITKSDTTTVLENQTIIYDADNRIPNPAISTLNSNGSNILNPRLTYTYYSETSCNGIALAVPPSDAGNYMVKATLNKTSNYNSSESGCVEYTINKKKATITLVDSMMNLISSSGTNRYFYDGDGTLSCTSSAPEYITCSVDTVNKRIKVGFVSQPESNVTITVSSTDGTNYTAADDVTFTVKATQYTVSYKFGPTIIKEKKVFPGTIIKYNDEYYNISEILESYDDSYSYYEDTMYAGNRTLYGMISGDKNVYWCYDKELTNPLEEDLKITSDITLFFCGVVVDSNSPSVFAPHNIMILLDSSLQDSGLTYVSDSGWIPDYGNFQNILEHGTGTSGKSGYYFDISLDDYSWGYEPGGYINITVQNTSGATEVYKIFLYSQYEPCLLADTEIEVEEEDKKGKKKRRRKKIQDITYDDNLVVWDFDNGCETTAKPIWIMETKETEEYYNIKFDDGTELNVVTAHRIFNLDSNKFTYLNDDKLTPIGTRVFKSDGTIARIVEKNKVRKISKYHNIVTEHHLNLFANGILTSCRLNNMYEIKDMKFVKDGRKLRDKSEFVGIDDKYIDGLRLLEQPDEDINRMNAVNHGETLRDYVIKNFLNNKKN